MRPGACTKSRADVTSAARSASCRLQPFPHEIVGLPRRVVVELAENLVAEPGVEARSGLEAERLQVRVGAATLPCLRFGRPEQAGPPALPPAVLIDAGELDVQPRCPAVAERPAADAILVVVQVDRDRTPVVAPGDDDVPGVETIAERLLLGGCRLIVPDETQRHRVPIRARAVATISSIRAQILSFAACTTLVRPAASGRADSAWPSKSTETPPAPATSGISFGTFSFTTTNAPPCDSIHVGASRQPKSTRPSALRLAYCRKTSNAPPS